FTGSIGRNSRASAKFVRSKIRRNRDRGLIGCRRLRSEGLSMRMTRSIIFCALFSSSGLYAQNAPAPAAITPRLDTPQVRVIVATLQPRTPSIARTGHATNRVLIYLDDGVMTRKEGEQTAKIEFHRGDVRWRPASGAYTAHDTHGAPC